MSIMGKKYPTSEEDFGKTFLKDLSEGKKMLFDPTKAGTRMQVPIPVTWERELSSKGKSAEVWANLVLNNQVPYMATMRNLRNMLLIGLPAEIHQINIDKIQNPKMVENAKMFPLQYFNAISEIDAILKKVEQLKDNTYVKSSS